MRTNYRTAKRDEMTCAECSHSRQRERSNRLECPHQGNYQVAKSATCDRVEALP